MKRIALLAVWLLPFLAHADKPAFRDVQLEGNIAGENASFVLKITIDHLSSGTSLPLVKGDVAIQSLALPSHLFVAREGDVLMLKSTQPQWWENEPHGEVSLAFAARSSVAGDWRTATFAIPVTPTRSVTVVGDRADLEIHVDHACHLQQVVSNGQSRVTGLLDLDPQVGIAWKTAIRKLETEVMASCDATTVANVSAGALRLKTSYHYQIAQGQISELTFDVPDITITRVTGANIQEWHVESTNSKASTLRVALGMPQRETYDLWIEGERMLPAFPCTVSLPVVSPEHVIRSNGNLWLGTDSAIKIQPADAMGLTQIDQGAFPHILGMQLPSRSAFTYQYAAMPYRLNLTLDDIVTALDAELGLVVNVLNDELTVDATIQVDVHDAPAREIRLLAEADSKWTVASVTGTQVVESDVDIRNVPGGREVIVPFRQPVSDTVVLHMRLEQPFGSDRALLAVPRISLPIARTQRGYILAAANRGLRLSSRVVSELRDVHTASIPIRVEGEQLAYRFRETPWKLELNVEHATPSIHTEVFHLISLGEGVMYASAAVTCHISGAPVQNLAFHIPASISGIDVIGAGIDNWTRSNDVCTVQLSSRVIGDYTLLITYDQPINYHGADLRVGEIATLGTDSEMGYIAVATSAGLKLTEKEALPQSLIRITRDELPPGYAATVTAPVIGAFKYVRRPHETALHVASLDTERVIDQVVDYLALTTRMSRGGESVTRALYCVKNASRQYLFVKLPPGASLWSVRQMINDHDSRDVASQQSGDVLYIPVARLRDPNQAISIEVTYATHGLPGSHWVHLVAPSLPETPVTYASWEIEAGDNLAIGEANGNMTPGDTLDSGVSPQKNIQKSTVRRFYRTANLASDEPLCIHALLVPSWMAGHSIGLFGAGILLGVVLLVVACIRRRVMWFAMGLVALAIGLMQTRIDGRGITLAGVIVLALLALVALARYVAWRVQRRLKKQFEESVISEEPPPFEPMPSSHSQDGRSGFVSCRMLAVLGFIGGLVMLAMAVDPMPAPAWLNAQRLEVNIVAPPVDPHAERTVAVEWKMHIVAERPGIYRMLESHSVLAPDTKLPSQLSLVVDDVGYLLNIRKAGEYDLEFRTFESVSELDGRYDLALVLPDKLINRFSLSIPAPDMDVTCDQAVSITTHADKVEKQGTRAEGVLNDARRVKFSWHPRTRITRLEQTVVYCDVSSVASIRAGVVDESMCARYQVAQGEIRELRVRVPDGVSVTSVSAPALATWSLDPVTRMLVAILSRPVTDAFILKVGLQMPCGSLPCDVTLAVPSVENVQRQSGQFALAASDAILLRMMENAGKIDGVTPINPSDFSLLGGGDWKQAMLAEPLRRAFRYEDPSKVRISLHAESVQPEVCVSETGSFSIGDERDILSAVCKITVSKAGVFSLNLSLPDGYDIESLSGPDFSHWDDSRHSGHGVDVFFNRRVLGTTTLNIVLARQQHGIPERVEVPRIVVQEAARFTGSLAVSADRGVRLVLDEQQGISVRKPELGEKTQMAALTFDILRPAWQATLHTQVMAPSLKPEMLHCVELAEGMLQHRIYVHYRIENAGVKTFLLRVPVKDATLSVSGRNIARVTPLAEDGGTGRVWQVELHGKVEDSYALTCFYQQPYDLASGGVTIHAFHALGVARQTSWLVVTGGGRVQVEPRGETIGLKAEDARSLPDAFGAGDLSGAIRCYRALRDDYRCDLSVVRHDAASVLPADVQRAQFTTVLSSSGKMLTQVVLDLKVGDLRFLRAQLPRPESTLWVAQVNGAEVSVSRDAGQINVPLDNLTADKTTTVVLVYADQLAGAGLSGRQTLCAPCFPDVPLRNIQWNFFLPSEYLHAYVEGDFGKPTNLEIVKSFEKTDYESHNKTIQSSSIVIARNNLKDIDGLLSSGKQREAQQALQIAVNSSQADQSLNEDARVQFRNVVQQQVKMGLVNRREELRRENNIFDEQAIQTREGFNDGNFKSLFVSQVEEQLTTSDRAALDRVSQRIVEQQAAAAGQGMAINVVMPEHGREVSFSRLLQSEKGGQLKVVFRFAHPSSLLHAMYTLWPAIPAFLLLWGLIKLAVRRWNA